MTRRGSRQGNKRQREQAKRRKKRDKEARRAAKEEAGTDGEVEVVDAGAFFNQLADPGARDASEEKEEEDGER